MAVLLRLPREIRDEIWIHTLDETPAFGHEWSSFGFFGDSPYELTRKIGSGSPHQRGILRVCKQICLEATPHFYEKVCMNLTHTNQVLDVQCVIFALRAYSYCQTLRWLQNIGPRNSACIRHLAIRYSSLLLDYNGEDYLKHRQPAWEAALECMPNLLSLNFDFKRDQAITEYDQHVLTNDTVLLKALANSARAWSDLLHLDSNRGRLDDFNYHPMRYILDGSRAEVHHAVIAIDEEVPEPLARYFAKLLQASNAASLDLPVTGLPDDFFRKQKLELAWTYALNDKTEKPAVTMAYQRAPSRPPSIIPAVIGHTLISFNLRYLRIGCRHIDSDALTQILPTHGEIETLDVAFTDPDSERVARNLETIQERYSKLFTFAIDVSPLHDRAPDDDSRERFFKRESVSKEVAEQWQPFWTRLDQISAGGVRVWEGEGPGFRRKAVRASSMNLNSLIRIYLIQKS